jgi:chlorite dismutase
VKDEEMSDEDPRLRVLRRRMKDLERRRRTLISVMSSIARAGRADDGALWWVRWTAKGLRTRAAGIEALAAEVLAQEPDPAAAYQARAARNEARHLREILQEMLDEWEREERKEVFTVVEDGDGQQADHEEQDP